MYVTYYVVLILLVLLIKFILDFDKNVINRPIAKEKM